MLRRVLQERMRDVAVRSWHMLLTRLDLILVLAATGVAVFFLFYRIDSLLPPYPWADETMIAADAVETLKQGPKVVYPLQLTGGSLAVYLEAIHIALFGKSLLGLRVLNALINVCLVASTYALVRLLFSDYGRLLSQLTALFTSVWLASSIWLLAVGRIAFTNLGLTPLVTTLCFYPLWLGLRTSQRRYFALAGMILGLSLYGYFAAFSVPLVLVVFFPAEWLISRLGQRPSLLSRHLTGIGYLIAAAALVALPLIVNFGLGPSAFLRRVTQIATVNQSFDALRLLQSAGDTLASFGLLPTWLLSGRWDLLIFDPLTAALFLIGVLIVLRQLSRPAYLFVLVWWAMSLLPAVLSAAASMWVFDLMRRAINSQPVSFVFPSLALVGVGHWLWSRRPHPAAGALPLVAASVMIFSAVNSFQFFFVDWIHRPETQYLFDSASMKLAAWMTAQATPDTVYIFPLRPGASPTTRAELFAVRTYYEGSAEAVYLDLDEATLADEMTAVSKDKSTIRLMLPDRFDLDPKDYLGFLLGQHAISIGDQDLWGFHVKTYRLKSNAEDFAVVRPPVPANTRFGEDVQLVDFMVSHGTLPAGETLSLALGWAALREIDHDYSAGLYVVDDRGHIVAQDDRPMLNDRMHLFTSHWTVGAKATNYYRLPVPASTPPGNYEVRVVVYNRAGERLVPAGMELSDLSLPLAEIRITPAALPIDPETLAIENRVDLTMSDELKVIGVDLPPDPARPGDQLGVSLTWQAVGKPQRDYGMVLGLVGANGLQVASAPQPLASAYYPTSEWRHGEIVQDTHWLRLPPELRSGRYTLALRLLDLATNDTVSEQVLQSLVVEARPHSFSMPSPSHLLNVGFGTSIRLIGNNQPIFSEETGELNIQVYWQALAEVPDSYKVFAHLLDSDDAIIAQSDFIPGDGTAPTTSWMSGEVITDTIRIQLPEEVSPGRYRLVVGLYNAASGVRLPVNQGTRGEDFVVLFEATIPDK